jgi:phosphoglycerate dehydrogenase-like enzyme
MLGGRVSGKMIENAKKLKLIQTIGQDTSLVAVKEALAKGIPVANAGGANTIAVAELVILLMLSCLRKFLPFNEAIREGRWRGNLDRKESRQLYERTVGIIGFGSVGRRVAKLCHAFGANIIYHEQFFVPYAIRADMKARPVSLDELLSEADIVSLHITSLEKNKAMIGWEQLKKMKPSAFLINTSRAAIIDEAALIRALNEKKIAGAALDVWQPEPVNPSNPLLKMPNVIATPHIAATAYEIWEPTVETVWRNMVMVSEGKEPLNRVREF